MVYRAVTQGPQAISTAEMGGLSGDERQAFDENVRRQQSAIRLGTEAMNRDQIERFVADQQAGRQRTQLLGAGRPGEAARVVTPDVTLPPDIRAQAAERQRQQIIEGQRGQAAQMFADTKNAIDASNASLTAMSGGLAGYNDRVRAATAATQAHNEALRVGPGIIDENTRSMALYEEQLLKAREALQGQNAQLEQQTDLQQRINAAGPFGTPENMRRVAAMAQLDQEAERDPTLAQSPEFQQRRQDVQRQQDVADQTDQVKAYAEAWTGAQHAAESALLAVTTHGERGRDAIKGLVQQVADLAIQAAIFKPLENWIGGGITAAFQGQFGSTLLGGIIGGAGGTAAATSSFGSLAGAGLYAKGDVLPREGLGDYSNQVVSSPTFFRFASGGVMGEAGPEAIMPLVRDSSGNLGVRGGAHGNQGGQVTVNTPITINANGGTGGGKPLDPAAVAMLQRQLDQTVRTSVRGVLADQKRPGGDLYFGFSS